MIGTYYRLSLADEDVGTDKTESNSIQGQRGLVEGYIMVRPELATEPRQEYVDDGYSGTSTSRPAFQRLIQDSAKFLYSNWCLKVQYVMRIL